MNGSPPAPDAVGRLCHWVVSKSRGRRNALLRYCHRRKRENGEFVCTNERSPGSSTENGRGQRDLEQREAGPPCALTAAIDIKFNLPGLGETIPLPVRRKVTRLCVSSVFSCNLQTAAPSRDYRTPVPVDFLFLLRSALRRGLHSAIHSPDLPHSMSSAFSTLAFNVSIDRLDEHADGKIVKPKSLRKARRRSAAIICT